MASSSEKTYEALELGEKAAFARKTYAILCIAHGCSDAALKKSFKKASLLYHPDKQVGKSDAEKATAETMFLKTKEAYELLSDSTKRAELDAAAAYADKAHKAQSERVERMDGARRKMRDEVERREAAARGEAYPKRQTAVVAEPTDPESRARRANAKRGADDAADRAKAKAAAAARDAAERKKKRVKDDRSRDERAARARRSVKLRWKGSAPSDEELAGFLRGAHATFLVEELDRSSSGKSAVLLLPDEATATNFAVDETIAQRFKEVRLLSPDAWERVQAAVAERAAAELGRAPVGNVRDDGAEAVARRVRERAALEAVLRDDDGDDSAANDAHARESAKRRRAANDPDLRANKRQRLLEILRENLDTAAHDADARDFAKAESLVISRLLNASGKTTHLSEARGVAAADAK